MAHVRSTLLGEVKSALAANAAIAKVYAQRVPPTRQLWPAVLVYAEAEAVEALGLAYPRQYLREMTLVIKGYVRPGQDEEAGETALDVLAVEIEDTLKYTSLTGEKDFTLVGTDWGQEEAGELLLLTVSLTYRLRYTSTEYSPETAT